MINDVFFPQLEPDIGRSLFADDEVLWKRGTNMLDINGRIQEAISKVEQWAYNWNLNVQLRK